MLTDDLRQELVNLFSRCKQAIASDEDAVPLLAQLRDKLDLLTDEEKFSFLQWYTQTDTGQAGAGVGDRVFVEVIRGGNDGQCDARGL